MGKSRKNGGIRKMGGGKAKTGEKAASVRNTFKASQSEVGGEGQKNRKK